MLAKNVSSRLMDMGEDQVPMLQDPELLQEQLSGYDHQPLFRAYALHEAELTERLNHLLSQSTPQPVHFEDPEHRLLITEEEAERIWGLFPKNARKRASPFVPIIKTGPPKWFARGSSEKEPIITENPDEALSPTSNAMGSVGVGRDGHRQWKEVYLWQLPENGFSKEVRKLAQIKVLVHELAHTFVATEWHHGKGSWTLRFPNGRLYDPHDLIKIFGDVMEEAPPISYYSSAYRNSQGKFVEDGAHRWRGIEEEVVEQITAYVLGFVVNPENSPNPGLNIDPFADGKHDKDDIEVYLNSERISGQDARVD